MLDYGGATYLAYHQLFLLDGLKYFGPRNSRDYGRVFNWVRQSRQTPVSCVFFEFVQAHMASNWFAQFAANRLVPDVMVFRFVRGRQWPTMADN
jgi:hypothetical protein